MVLWWYASTCRHLGIGGTHQQPAVVAAQKAAMRTYHDLERFFKRGEFYGINEEVHLHVLPEENAFVVNLFNLSDQKRTISGSMELDRLGLQGMRLAAGSKDADAKGIGSLKDGVWTIQRDMAPWSAEVVHVARGALTEPTGDWSIFRREIVFCRQNAGRKHGPVPLRGLKGTVPFSSDENRTSPGCYGRLGSNATGSSGQPGFASTRKNASA